MIEKREMKGEKKGCRHHIATPTSTHTALNGRIHQDYSRKTMEDLLRMSKEAIHAFICGDTPHMYSSK